MGFDACSDRELVAALIANDGRAWEYVLVEVLAPILKMQKYTSICRDHSLSSDAVLTRVWMILQKNDYARLRKFRFEASFKTYLFLIVREAQRSELREKIGKVPLVLSDDEAYTTQIACSRSDDTCEIEDEMSVANRLLGRLWKDNPKQAMVLLMRTTLGITSKDVALFLQESSANVDQLNKRAKEKMKALRKECRL